MFPKHVILASIDAFTTPYPECLLYLFALVNGVPPEPEPALSHVGSLAPRILGSGTGGVAIRGRDVLTNEGWSRASRENILGGYEPLAKTVGLAF